MQAPNTCTLCLNWLERTVGAVVIWDEGEVLTSSLNTWGSSGLAFDSCTRSSVALGRSPSFVYDTAAPCTKHFLAQYTDRSNFLCRADRFQNSLMIELGVFL